MSNHESDLNEILDMQICCNIIYKGKYYKIKMSVFSVEEISESEYNNTKELKNEL